MTNLDERVDKLEEKYSDLHTVINVLAAKVDATNEKVDNLISEMRDRDNQRHAEIAEIRQSVQSIQDSGRNQTIVTFLGIAAMVVAVLLK